MEIPHAVPAPSIVASSAIPPEPNIARADDHPLAPVKRISTPHVGSGKEDFDSARRSICLARQPRPSKDRHRYPLHTPHTQALKSPKTKMQDPNFSNMRIHSQTPRRRPPRPNTPPQQEASILRDPKQPVRVIHHQIVFLLFEVRELGNHFGIFEVAPLPRRVIRPPPPCQPMPWHFKGAHEIHHR